MTVQFTATEARSVRTVDDLTMAHLLVLFRVAAAGGATKAEIARDLAPLAAPRLEPVQVRPLLERALAELVMDGHVQESRSRFALSEDGVTFAASVLAPRKSGALTWQEIRDTRLMALALGLSGASAARLKTLAKPDDLRSAVVVQAFGLKLKSRAAPTPARLRCALAVLALKRAFGNKVSALGSGRDLAPKAGRLLAAQLLAKPRDPGTDSRLIAALAAEHTGARSNDIDALRQAVLRNFVSQRLVAERPKAGGQRTLSAPETPPRPANDTAPARPDPEGFAAAVQSAAAQRSEGWPGNRKAFICHVWEGISATYPQWRLSEIEFKCMLVEAHRAGHIALANADLKDKRQLKDFQASAVTYKNTVWHFVRVEE